jgi:AhpD family alkylhydroperoxidase
MANVDKEIKETFGFVPEFYDVLPKSAREAGWRLHQQFEHPDYTALDNKTKELIGLAMASHIKCKYCIYFHTRTSETFGASPQEIKEAIAMGGLTVLFSNSLTGSQLDFDKFKKEVDRALEYVTSK